MRPEQKFIKRLERIAAKEHPIYDHLNPNPVTGRVDCPNTVNDKKLFRAWMILDMVKNMKKFDAGYV